MDATFKPFPWRIFLRTIALRLTLLLLAVTVSGMLARTWFKEKAISQFGAQLEAAIELASHDFNSAESEKWCEHSARGTQYRVTLVNIDGNVICDSHHNASTMENHLDRPEISDAIGSGKGFSVRLSGTDNSEFMYLARTLAADGPVLRFALSINELSRFLNEFDRAFAYIVIFIGVLLTVGELWVARVFVQPLRSILMRAESALRTQEIGIKASDLGKSSWGEWEHLEGVIESLRLDVKEKIEALRSEKKEQGIIMNSISDALVVVNRDETVAYANRIFKNVFPGHEEYVGKNILQFCREPAVQKIFLDVLQTGVIHDAAVVGINSSYGIRYFSVAVTPLLSETDVTYGAVGILHDVTDLKLAEQMRIDFVANVSHEIRTPLSSIKGYADTVLSDLRAGVPVEETLVEPIVRNSDRMVRLVADLLDLSALDAGTHLDKSAIDVCALTQKIAETFEPLLASKNQKIEIECSEVPLFGDGMRVEQVMANFIENAHKYTPEGTRICVAWKLDKSCVELVVSDNGPGIEEQHLSRLFERFYRVDKGRSRNLGGTGLGLAIVKHIMMAHGGKVWVESKLGFGTAFHCSFPLVNL